MSVLFQWNCNIPWTGRQQKISLQAFENFLQSCALDCRAAPPGLLLLGLPLPPARPTAATRPVYHQAGLPPTWWYVGRHHSCHLQADSWVGTCEFLFSDVPTSPPLGLQCWGELRRVPASDKHPAAQVRASPSHSVPCSTAEVFFPGPCFGHTIMGVYPLASL